MHFIENFKMQAGIARICCRVVIIPSFLGGLIIFSSGDTVVTEL